ncbi:MAG: dimethyl sulfoxide reductase anchor subunit family protein, partial [Pseudomonadota bacterium]
LLSGGLLASFFHFGHPERAWRAAAKWRTSWLSREVIVLPAFIAAVCGYGLTHYLGRDALLVGAIGAVLCATLFVCTAMIYACIKFLQEWAHPLTVVNYTLLGSASGFTLATACAAFAAPDLVAFFGKSAMWLTIIAFATRYAALLRNARLKPKSTLQSAIGVKHGNIVQKAQGAMGGSFNTREFFHGKSIAFLRSVKSIFLVLTFPLPLLLIAAGLSNTSTALLTAAFFVQYAGLVAERWFFFAQANHPQNLYYQTIS